MQPEIDGYIAQRTGEGLAPATLQRDGEVLGRSLCFLSSQFVVTSEVSYLQTNSESGIQVRCLLQQWSLPTLLLDSIIPQCFYRSS